MKDDEYNKLARRYTRRWQTCNCYASFGEFKRTIKKGEDALISQTVSHVATRLDHSKEMVRVLDLGCGNGELTVSFLAALGVQRFSYTGVDCNAVMLEQHALKNGPRNGPCILVETDMNAYSPSGSFDLIVSFNSVYSLLAENVTRFANYLYPSGLYILLMNSREGLFARINKSGRFGMVSDEDVEDLFRGTKGYAMESHELCYDFSSTPSILGSLNYLTGDAAITVTTNGQGTLLEKERLLILSRSEIASHQELSPYKQGFAHAR